MAYPPPFLHRSISPLFFMGRLDRLFLPSVHLTSFLYGSVGPHRQGCSDVANRVDTHVVWLSQGLLRVLRLGGGSGVILLGHPKKLFEWKKKSFF